MFRSTTSLLLICRSARLFSPFERQAILGQARITSSSYCTSKNADVAESVRQTNKDMEKKHQPTKFDKWMLVKTKKYKSVDEIPDSIPPSVMEKSRSKFRIYVNVAMIVLTLIGCFAMAQVGKKELAEGKSLHRITLDRHEK